MGVKILNIQQPLLFTKIADLCQAITWYGLLVLIGYASFLFGGYGSAPWLVFSGYFYFWVCFSVVIFGFTGRINRNAIKSAKSIIVLMLLSLFWLWLQLYMPYEHAIYDALARPARSGFQAPNWYNPLVSWSVTPQRTRWLLMSELMMFCLFFATLSTLDSRRRLKQLLALILVVGLSHAVIGLFGQYTKTIFVDAKQVDGHFSVARGLFVNRNHYAAFLVLTLFGGLAYQFKLMLSRHSSSFKQLLLLHINFRHMFILTLVAVITVGVVSSQSRAPVLSLAVALILAFIIVGTDHFRNKRVIIIPLFIVGALAFVYFGEQLLARLGSEALSLGERWDQWLITFKAINANLFLGYGGGSYITVFQIFRDQTELRDVVFAQSHNHYLHLWLERGLIGLVLWLAVFFLIIQRAKNLLPNIKSNLVGGVVFSALVVVLAALVQSFVDYNLQMLNIRAYFFIIVAIMFASPHIKHERS